MGIKELVFTVIYAVTVLMPQNTSNAAQFGQKVVRQGDNIYISFRYKPDTDMHLLIGKCGINQILGIKAIYLDKNRSNEVSPYASKNAVLFMKSSSDWIGPYAIKSLSHDDGGQYNFTGGWHGNKIKGTDVATATTYSFSVKANGKELAENKIYNGDVEITVTNYIQAYNTKKIGVFVLREAVDYNITPSKISVSVESTALEDIIIMKYYGLQTQDYPWKGLVEYSNGLSAVYGEHSDSGHNEGSVVDTFTLLSVDQSYRLVTGIDTSYGLGTFENLDKNQPYAFTESYGKTYFNLINGINKNIAKGNSISWRGYYLFK